MDFFGDTEYQNYWETNMFLQTQELDSWGLVETLSTTYYDSRSPEGTNASPPGSKNIVSERNRRKKLNDRLFALRAVVPNISKVFTYIFVPTNLEFRLLQSYGIPITEIT